MHRAQLSHSTSVLTTCASSSRRSKAAPPRFCGVKFQLLEQQGVRFLTFFILPLFFLPRFHLRLPLPPQCRCCITSLRCLSSRLIYDPPLSERQISREIHLSQSVREREREREGRGAGSEEGVFQSHQVEGLEIPGGEERNLLCCRRRTRRSFDSSSHLITKTKLSMIITSSVRVPPKKIGSQNIFGRDESPSHMYCGFVCKPDFLLAPSG